MGFNSVTNHRKLHAEHYEQILSSFPLKTLQKLVHVTGWSDVTMELIEEIFCKSNGVYSEYTSVRGCSYLKVICNTKKEWDASLENLKGLSGFDRNVSAFAEQVEENLAALSEDQYHVASYIHCHYITFIVRTLSPIACASYPNPAV